MGEQEIMGTILGNIKDWLKKIEEWNLEKEEKEQVENLKKQIIDLKRSLKAGIETNKEFSEEVNYIRHNSRIILSAPEIIIGGVDREGMLCDGDSKVVLRAKTVELQGVGGAGEVITRASKIKSIAEDPGDDGKKNIVQETSEIISQAKSIALISEDSDGVFIEVPNAYQGIQLNSDAGIELNATLSNNKKEDAINKKKQNVLDIKGELLEKFRQEKKDVDLSKIEDAKKKEKELTEDEEELLGDGTEIGEVRKSATQSATEIYRTLVKETEKCFQVGELNRQLACIDEMDKEVKKKKDEFSNKTTNTYISLKTERVNIRSVDGDGNIRVNPEAGVSINAKQVDVGTFGKDGSLQDDSSITLASRKVEICTLNPSVQRNEKKEITAGEYPAVGDVLIHSKNIWLGTVDYEWKEGELVEKALTKDGTIAMRAEKVDVSVTDTEGKATGQVGVNAKAIEVKGMDVDKKKRTDTGLAAGSTMLLLSEKMLVGAKDSNNRSQQMQVVGDKTVVIADTTLELQQKDAVVQLSGGNAAVGGGNLDLYGKTTLQGDVTAKGKVAGGDIEMKNMKVTSSFRTPMTSEGVAVPGAPATGKLNAQLKEVELKTEE